MKKVLFIILLFGFTQLQAQFQQKVVVEENTGTWCQWCPRGEVYGEKLVHDYSNAILIAVHSGSDPMDYPDYATATTLTSAPSGNINRTILDIDPLNWASSAQNLLTGTTFAKVDVYTSYNTSTREVSVDVTATFGSNQTGNYRLAAVIVEDAVTGPSPDYDQSNAYSGGTTPMGGFEHLPSPVPAYRMAYNHVARHLLGGYDGTPNSIPGSVSSGSSHTQSYTYTLPSGYDENYVRIVGLLIDQTSGEIINAELSSYLPGHTNGSPHFITSPITNGYVATNYTYDVFARDPEQTNLVLTAPNLPPWLSLTDDGEGNAQLSGTPLASGSYPITLSVSDGTSTIDQNFNLVIDEEPPFGWEYVGPNTLSNHKISRTKIEIAKDNTPYLMTIDDDLNNITVQKFENGSWSIVGSPNIAGPTYHANITTGPNSNPWLVFASSNANTIQVMEFSNNQWTTIGSTNSNGVYVDIAVDDSNQPYVTFMDINSQSKGKVITYINTTWQTLSDGGNNFFSSSPATWQQIDLDSQGNPLVLWADYDNNKVPMVSKYSAGSWENLNNTPVSTSGVLFYQGFGIDQNDNVYVAFTKASNDDIDVYQYDGLHWFSIGTNIAQSSTENTCIGVSEEGDVYVGYLDNGFGKKTSVKNLNNQIWEYTGPKGFTNAANDQSIAIDTAGVPLVSYVDQVENEFVSVKRYYDLRVSTEEIAPTLHTTTVYPSPSNHQFTVDNLPLNATKLSIYGPTGQLIYYQNIDNKRKISVNQLLPSGIYYINIRGARSNETIKHLIIR